LVSNCRFQIADCEEKRQKEIRNKHEFQNRSAQTSVGGLFAFFSFGDSDLFWYSIFGLEMGGTAQRAPACFDLVTLQPYFLEV
jgi:hypothetical protein